MTHISRLVLLLAVLVASKGSAKAADSLYSKRDSRKLKPNEQGIFGPQSGKFHYDSRMIKASEIAAERARKHSTSRCWAYVKNALVAAHLVDSRPTTGYAKEAGTELQDSYGFRRIRVSDPYKAPLGSVLVYGGRGAGHVEFRTRSGFVSDFTSATPSKRPLIGVYIKPRA